MKFKPFKAPAGTSDILPCDNDYFTFIKKIIRHRFRQSGFRRIEVPMFEETEVFERSLGTGTEIIKREIYSFKDPRDRDYSLRPEMTTGIVRSFIENEMHKDALPVELYSIGKCFRFERPQSRTKRAFWQFGGEVLGESDPAIDAQIIYLGHNMLQALKVRDKCELRINTIGSPEDRAKFIEALANFYAGKERSLSIESREKLEQKKYLDLLNPRNEDEEVLLEMAPKITDFLSDESREFFEQTLAYLNSFNIEYTIDHGLVRPLEYYSHTVFEFREKEMRNKIMVGGRYDGLVEKMGGPDLGGCGFAAGLERIVDLMKRSGVEVPHKDDLEVFVAATGPIAKKHALPILVKLREEGFNSVGVLGKTSMEEQLNRAAKFKVPYTILMGDVEVKKGQLIIRDMKKGRSRTIDVKDVVEEIKKLFPPKKKAE